MRKWQNLAPPDDPGSYFDVDGFVPTARGTYETADSLSGVASTASGCATPTYAWSSGPISSTYENPEFICDGTNIFWYRASSGAMSNVTGTATFRTTPHTMMAQYGNVTIAVMGATEGAVVGAATVSCANPSANFGALAGAPQGRAICVQSNAVWIFNTDSSNDGWAMSDVGDYTNWTTGESASGRLLATHGAINAAVAYRDAVYAFKGDSIYRLRYVGGQVKVATELVWNGTGALASNNGNLACAGASGILFVAPPLSTSQALTPQVFWYDGANPPVCVNLLTDLTGIGPQAIVYNPAEDVFSLWSPGLTGGNGTNTVHYFCPSTGMWGQSSNAFTSTYLTTPVQGDFASRPAAQRTHSTTCWGKDAANSLTRHAATGSARTDATYVETAKVGSPFKKTQWRGLFQMLRRRSGAGSGALTVRLFRERHDTSVASTPTATEMTAPLRFDFMGSDFFARFKATYTNLDVEVDDLIPDEVGAGKR